MAYRLIPLILLALPLAAQAESYDDLVSRTRSSYAEMMGDKGIPAATPASPAPVLPAKLAPPERRTAYAQPVAALPVTAQPEPGEENPLLSGTRLQAGYHGIRKELGMLVVPYTFASATPVAKMRAMPDQKFRTLTEAEKKAVRDVLNNQLPRQVAIRFEEAGDPKKAYLRVMASDLASLDSPLSGQMLGYASYPNPRGGQLVIDEALCSPLKQDCTRLKAVVRHEIGHTLGLQHPQDAPAKWHRLPTIMQAHSQRYSDYQPNDIASLQKLYGTAQSALPARAERLPEGEDGERIALPSILSRLENIGSLSEMIAKMLGSKD